MIRDTSAQDREIATSGGASRRWLLAAVLIAIAALAAVVVTSVVNVGGAEQYISRDGVRVAMVQRGDFLRDIAVQGRVVAAVSPTLYAPDQGTVTLSVMAGDTVKLGQLLAIIESAETQNQLQQEQASLSGAEVDLKRQRIQVKKNNLINQQSIDLAAIELTTAQREHRRAESASEAITQHERDRAKDAVESTELKLQHAQHNAELEEESLDFELETVVLNVQRQRLLVEDLQRRVAELYVVSPVAGIVGNVIVEQKEAVTRNQPLLTVVDLTEFEVEIEIPQTYADELTAGLGTSISDSGREYDGMLAAISPEVVNNQVQGRVRFAPSVNPDVKQNQRVSARILLESKSNVLTLRRGPFLENRSGRIAYVVEGDVATRREVVTGSASVSEVEILSGLKEGETVIISNTNSFNDAQTMFLTN